jgi:hypothetical protein
VGRRTARSRPLTASPGDQPDQFIVANANVLARFRRAGEHDRARCP